MVDLSVFSKGVTMALAGALVLIAMSLLVGYRFNSDKAESHGHQVVSCHVDQLNQYAIELHGLGGLFARNRALRSEVGSDTEVRIHAFKHLVQAEWPNIGTDPKQLASKVVVFVEALRQENASMDVMNRRRSEVEDLLEQAIMQANRNRNLAVFAYLDRIQRRLNGLEAVADLSDWDHYSQELLAVKEEIDLLMVNMDDLANDKRHGSKQQKSDSAPPHPNETSDPYAVLGVRSDLNNQQIKDVYRKLAQIYHPDKGYVRDRKQFQDLQVAWQSICKTRSI